MSRKPVGMPKTAHGAGFLRVSIGKLKTLLLDQPNEALRPAAGQIHRMAIG